MKRRILSSATALALTTLTGLGTQPAAALMNETTTKPAATARVSDFDLNLVTDAAAIALPSTAQERAWAAFRAEYPHARIRWDQASGSIDALYGFAGPATNAAPEDAALDFIAEHNDLLGGIDLAGLNLDPYKSREALGGHLLRFDQFIDGVKVEGAGLGVVLDGENRVLAMFGPVYPTLNVALEPSLDAAAAVAGARADLAGHARMLPAEALSILESGYQAIESQLGPLLDPQPELRVFMSPDGPRTAWQFYLYSRNPFGLFKYTVDAATGEVLQRIDQVKYQEDPTEMYADYFPTFPTITEALKEDCAILDANGQEIGTPLGQLRIKLRKFDQSNRVTGADGILTGDHALIQNALPTKAPFAQPAAGTWFFDADEIPLKGRTEERDHLEEPSEHQDEISQFIYITQLIEYLDYLHKAGDAVHNPGLGEGDFPDSYPNESTPLTGTVHLPNVLDAPDDPEDPDFFEKLVGFDNAFAVPVSTEIGGEEVVVNPTAYGHGYLFNDLAMDFSVPMHEGTHATITPIAGFEGSPEGGALNEGQADLWAYSIGETPVLGAYPVAGCKLREYLRENGIDPDSWEYIRSAQSQIRYSQLGTRGNQYEVHRDGEIYAGAMWDLRELMNVLYPDPSFVRPDPITGTPNQPASLGKETWERIFLGSMYILSVSNPDTMTRARDALLLADSILYPTDPLNIGAPGRHFALIERVFAARELGVHAAAPLGGRQTVSSSVSEFTAGQPAPATPQNVVAEVVDEATTRIRWSPVDGALGYQVLKRRKGDPTRLFRGVPGREYFEGDAEFSSFTHVEYVLDGTEFIDHGQGFGRGPGQGLDSLTYDYVVRAIGLAENGQVGFSDLSGTAEIALARTNVSDSIDARISNVSFDGTFFEFDQKLTNEGTVAVFEPVEFEILSISEPDVSVANADNGGSGHEGDPATFVYADSLAPGETSGARHLRFSDPNAKLFTFSARVTGQLRTEPRAGVGSQDPVDVTDRNEAAVLYHYTEEYTGVVPIGSAGLNQVNLVDHVDVAFTAQPSALGVDATLTAEPEAGGAYPDLDFELLDPQGQVIATSGNLGPNEKVSGALVPNETHTLRVVGFANGPTVFHIFVDQIVTDPADAGEGPGGGPVDILLDGIEMEFTVNPVTGEITGSVL